MYFVIILFQAKISEKNLLISKKRKLDLTESSESPSNNKVSNTNGNIKVEHDEKIITEQKKCKNKSAHQGSKKIALDSPKPKHSLVPEDSLSSSNIPNISLSDVAGCHNAISVRINFYLFIITLFLLLLI